MLRTLFVDFNAYFASVEQQINPALRGRPVGVPPVMADTSCCIAASYEAKAFGTKTSTKVENAIKLYRIKRFSLRFISTKLLERQNL